VERIIKGPAWESDYGTAEQCAKFVGIDPPLWLELDRADLIFPPAARRSREIARWHWHSAVMVSLSLIQLTGKLRAWLAEQKKSSK
jgi:hypothetical protein